MSPLPQVDFPTIQVSAPSAGSEPRDHGVLRRDAAGTQFGRIAGVTEMTSIELSRLDVDHAAVRLEPEYRRRGARRAGGHQCRPRSLPANLPSNPTYRKVNPADAPIMILALTSDIYDPGRMYDAASTILQQKLSQIDGVGQVTVGGGSLPAVRVDVNPTLLNKLRARPGGCAHRAERRECQQAQGQIADDDHVLDISTNDQLLKADDYKPLIVAYQNGAAVRLVGCRQRTGFGRRHPRARLVEWQAGRHDHHLPPAGRQYHRDRRPRRDALPQLQGCDSCQRSISRSSSIARPRFGPPCMTSS